MTRTSARVRKLQQGEEASTDAFLATTPETTLFLRSNLARAGLVDDGAPFSGTWVGAFEDDRLAGVAASFWNGNVVTAPGAHASAAAAEAVQLSGRRVLGILGPHDEVVQVRQALGLVAAPTRFASKEILYALPLDALVVPPALADGHLVARPPLAEEMNALIDWRMAYSAETLGTPVTEEARLEQARYLARLQEAGHHFVLTASGEHVAYSAFNATVADTVQIGGVWTPPALRGRGFARAVVAGSLQHARSSGVRRAILFTSESNAAAQAAYLAIGFRPVGDYAIVLFA